MEQASRKTLSVVCAVILVAALAVSLFVFDSASAEPAVSIQSVTVAESGRDKAVNIWTSGTDPAIPSNNFDISFDINTAAAGLSIHLDGLVQGANLTRIYITSAGVPMIQSLVGGTYWFGLYAGDGIDKGVYDGSSITVPSGGTVRLRVVHVDGIISFYVNNILKMRTALDPFAGNPDIRLTEGTVTAVALEVETGNVLTASNITVSEYDSTTSAESQIGSAEGYSIDSTGTIVLAADQSINFTKNVLGSLLEGSWYVDDVEQSGQTLGFQFDDLSPITTKKVYYKVGEGRSNTLFVKRVAVGYEPIFQLSSRDMGVGSYPIMTSAVMESNNYSVSFDINTFASALSIHMYNLVNGSNCSRLYINTSGAAQFQLARNGWADWSFSDAVPFALQNGTAHVELIHCNGLWVFKVDGVIILKMPIADLASGVTEGAINNISLETEHTGLTVSNLVLRQYNEEDCAGIIIGYEESYVPDSSGAIMLNKGQSVTFTKEIVCGTSTGHWFVDGIEQSGNLTISYDDIIAGSQMAVCYKVGDVVSNTIYVKKTVEGFDPIFQLEQRSMSVENFTLMGSALMESNNYVVSFEIDTIEAGLSIHFYNLAQGSDCSRLFIMKSGATLFQIATTGFSQWYNVGGPSVTLVDGKAEIALIHYNGYLIFKLNGVARAWINLADFDSHQFTEGSIDRISIECETAGVLTIRNLLLKQYNDAEDAESVISFTGAHKTDVDGTVWVSNLGELSFSVQKINSTLDGTWYVNGQVSGQNAPVISGNADDEFEVYYQIGAVRSNTVTVKVYDKSLELSASSDYVAEDGSINFTATTEGVGDDEDFTWYIKKDDGTFTVVENQTTSSLTISPTISSISGQFEVYCTVSGMQSETLKVIVASNPLFELEGDNKFDKLFQLNPSNSNVGENFAVDNDEGYIYSTLAVPSGMASCLTISQRNGGGALFDHEEFEITFQFYLPLDACAHVYLCITGMDKNNSASAPEARMVVANGSVMFDFKYFDQANDQKFVGKNTLTIGAKGSDSLVCYETWHTYKFVAYDNKVSAYVDGQQVSFATLDLAVAAMVTVNMYPYDGIIPITIRLKDVSVYGLAEPAPPVDTVNLSTSGISTTVGNSVTLRAQALPFTSKPKQITWYVNDQVVSGQTSTEFVFTPEAEGTYVIKCVIDGVVATKTITVTAAQSTTPPEEGGDGEGGGGSNLGLILGLSGGGVGLSGAGLASFLVIRKRKRG